MIKAKDLRDKSTEELKALLIDAKKVLFDLINEINVTKKIENPSAVKFQRRDIARINTVIRARELGVI